MKFYSLYALAIGFSLNLVFVMMFYHMLLINQKPIVTLNANTFGEYWIEFFLLQIGLIITAVALITETKRYYKQ